MARHERKSAPETVHWRYWDAMLPPVLRVRSGDEVTVHTVSGRPDHLPEDRRRVPDDLAAILARVTQGPAPHILTGPIYVEGRNQATSSKWTSWTSRSARIGRAT